MPRTRRWEQESAGEEMAARAAELEAVYAAQNDAVLIYDTEMFVHRVNPTFLSVYGFDPVGMHVSDIIRKVSCRSMDGQPLELTDQPTPRALRGEKVVSVCYRITRPSDGKETIVETSSGPMRMGDRIIGSATVWHDITGLKQMEGELRESRRHLSAIVESIADGFYSIDRQWRITHVNDEALGYFGLTREKMLGRTMHELFPRFVGSVFEQKYRRAMETGESAYFETPSVVKDLIVEMHIYPGQDNLSVLFRDVTERYTLAENLRRSEARFKLLSETAGALLATEEPQAAIEALCSRVMEHLDCQTFFNFLADEHEDRLRLNACDGIPKEEARKIEWLDYGIAVCGCVAQQGVRIIAEDIQNSHDPRTDLVKTYGIQAYCCHPLLAQGRVIGTLSFGTRTRMRFSDDEVALMKTVADQVAIAMERIHAQNALKAALEEADEGRRTLQALMDNVPEGITIADAPDANIRMVSRYGREILGGTHEGITAEEVAQKWTIFQEDGRTPMAAHDLPLVRAIMNGEVVRDAEVVQKNVEGRYLPLLCNAAPIRDSEGSILGGIVAWRDITELKKRESELNKLNRTLRALNGSNQALMRCTDEDQFLQEVCRIVVEDCGYSMVWIGYAEDDEGKTVRPMAYAGFDAGYVESLNITWADTERGRGPTGTAIRTGCPCECRNMLTDSAFGPWREEALKRGYASSLVLPLMAGDKVIGAMTIYSGEPDYFIRDELRLLTDLASDLSSGISAIRLAEAHRLAEEALRKSEQRFSSLFSAMSEGFAIHEIILDDHGKPVDYRFLDINPSFEQLTGLRRDDVVGRAVSEILPHEDPFWVEAYGKVALTGEPVRLERYSPVLRRHFEIFSYRPAPLQFAVVFMDVTRRKEAEEEVIRHRDHLEELVRERTAQLEARNLQLELEITERRRAEEDKKSLEAQLVQTQKIEALGRFAGGIAHDLNNILYPIIINTQMLLDETAPDSPARETLSQLLGAAYRQRDLIRQILSFSRRSDQQLKPVKVKPLVKETLVLMKSSLPPNIEIRQVLDVASDKVLGDPTQIQQIIMNLCRNAVDAIGQVAGLIEVGLGNVQIDGNLPHPGVKPGEYLLLTVRDNGCGMPPDMMDRIFEPFFTTKDVGQGSGMGLAVIHGIIKGHGGAITVKSEPGSGTLFTVYIPLTGEKSRGNPAPEAVQAPKTRLRVLFVDDEDIILFSVGRVLKILGYEVAARKDSREALQAFSEAPGEFDLVMTDLTMPHMNGLELAAKLRELRRDIPVILCTGFSDTIDRRKVEEMGICELLMKPADIDELKAVITRALEKR
jgi:PAS domain S-box-containing protein